MKFMLSHTAGIAISRAASTAIHAAHSAQLATRHLNKDILGISKEARVKRLFKYLIIVHLIVVALAIAVFNTPYIMKSIQINSDIYNTTDVSTDKVLVDDSIDEDASDYLSRTNFKSLIEWLTAESILCRPDDPLQFLHDIMCEKINQRTESNYKPTDATEYVIKVYAEASASADEDGRIYGNIKRMCY